MPDNTRSRRVISLPTQPDGTGVRGLAVRYCLVAIGEALDWVPAEILAHEPQIPWRKVIALRHRLVHGYWLIDEELISEIARSETDALIAALDRLIERLR